MPQTFDIEGVGHLEFPDDAKPEEIQQFLDENYNKAPKTSALGAGLRAGATGLLPTGAGIGTAVALETAFAPETAGASLLLIPPSLLAAYLAGKGQQKVIHKVAPEFEKLQAAGEEQHPIASAVGSLAAAAPFAEFAPGQLLTKKAFIPATIGATIGAVQPLAEGRTPTVTDIAAGAAGMAMFGRPRGFVEAPAAALGRAVSGREAYASSVKEAAKVHGDLRPQPGEGPGQVPPEAGGPGVQPPTPGVAEAAQVPLSAPYRIGGNEKSGFFVDIGGRRETGFETEVEAKHFAEQVGRGEAQMTGPVIKPEERVKIITKKMNQDLVDLGWSQNLRSQMNYDDAQHIIENGIEPPEKGPAKVAAATFTDPRTGETTAAPHHPAAAAQQGVDATGPRQSRETEDFNYVDENGNVLSREQAEERARETDQLLEEPDRPGQPHSDQIAAPGTDVPISEAGTTIASVKAKINAGIPLTPDELEFAKSVSPVHGINLKAAKVAAPQPAPGVQVPVMITRAMEENLRSRGYSQEQINKMSPQMANDILTKPAAPSPKIGEIIAKRKRGEPITLEEKAILDAARPLSERAKARKAAEAATGMFPDLDKVVADAASDVGLEHTLTYTPPPEGDETVPFAQEIAYIDRKSGRLVLNRAQLEKTLMGMPVENQHRYIERLINEEHLHSKTSDEDALKFFNNSTDLEKGLSFKQYTGFDTPEALFKAKGVRFTDTQLGHEMVRQRLQQLSRLGVREVVELSGRERWKASFIDALQRIIYNLRRAFGGRATDIQQDIINRMQANLDAVKQSRGETTAAFARTREEELPEPPKGERLVSVVKPDGTRYVASHSGKSYDLTQIGKGIVPSIARRVEGKWSHGMLGQGERIIEDGGRSASTTGRLPAVEPGMVRLYHGEGGAEGAGMYSNWFSRVPERAASYGGQVSYVDVPKEVADASQQMVRRRGIGTPTDHLLPTEWAARAQAVPGGMEVPTHEIAAAFAKDPQREQKHWSEKDLIRFQVTSGWRKGDYVIVTRDPMGGWRATLLSKSEEETRYGIPGQLVPETHEVFPTKGQAVEGAQNMLHNFGVEDYRIVPESEPPAAFKRETKAEREARIAREKATPAMAGFEALGAPEIAPKLKGEVPLGPLQPTSAEEAGAGVPEGAMGSVYASRVTPDAMKQEIKDAVTAPEPDYNAFLEKLQKQYGIPNDQASKIFEDGFYNHLMNAPAERLRQLVKEQGLEQKLISRIAAQKMRFETRGEIMKRGEGEITPAEAKEMAKRRGLDLDRLPEPLNETREKLAADLLTRPMPDAKKVLPVMRKVLGSEAMIKAYAEKPAISTPRGDPVTVKELKQIEKGLDSQSRFRGRVISVLIGETMKRAISNEMLTRKVITPDDIDFTNKSTAYGPFYQFSAKEASDPKALRRIMSDEARVKGQNVSITKRLIVLVHKISGRTEVADGYIDGRKGLVVMRPAVAGVTGKHVPIEKLLTPETGLRPVYAMLVRDPVQDYHRSYKNLGEFNREIDAPDALARSRPAALADEIIQQAVPGYELPEATDIERKPSETPGEEEVTFRPATKAPPGGLMAAGRTIHEKALKAGITTGELQSLLTVADANEVREPMDLKVMVDIINEMGRRGELRGSHYQVLTALDKIVSRTHDDMMKLWMAEKEETIKRGEKWDDTAFPMPTPESSFKLALRNVYDLITRAEEEDFVQAGLERYGQEPERGPVTLTPPEIPESARGAESIQREVEVPGMRPPAPGRRLLFRRAEGPAPEPPLSTAGRMEVARQAAERFPYTPSGEAERIVEAGKPTGRILEYGAPEFRTKTGLVGPRKGEPPPAAFFKDPKDQIEREANKVTRGFAAMIKRNDISKIIAAAYDYAKNSANNAGNQSKLLITMAAGGRAPKTFGERLSGATYGGKKEVLAAANAVLQSGFDKSKLDGFRDSLQTGRLNAQHLLHTGNWFDRVKAKAWLKNISELEKEIDYADAHWDDKDLRDTAERARYELDSQYLREVKAGSSVRYEEDYLPGRYEGEFFNDGRVVFGAINDMMGRQWRAPKTFDTYYDAAADGPYIPVSRNISDIVGSRVRQGMNSINYKAWAKGLKNLIDPVSGQRVAADVVKRTDGSPAPVNRDSEVWYPTPYDPMSIRKGYRTLLDDLTKFSSIQSHHLSRVGLEFAQRLKHLLLIGDFFHLGRMGYYAAASMGIKNMGFRRGLAILDFAEADLPAAVKAGLVSKEAAAWATTKVPVNLGGGRTAQYSRIEIGKMLQEKGLNNGRIQDALYKELVVSPLTDALPGMKQFTHAVSRYNKWLFDKVTRGFITEAAVKNFERYNKANPNMDVRALMRDVAHDANNFFGNIGHQGWIKSATYQDLARMAFLAPQWVEGLVMKDVGLATRLAGAPVGYRKGLPPLGLLGRSVGVGMLTMIGLTQAINFLTTGKPTWENEEKGHKFDAYIPSGNLWFSPLSVFNEIAHDLVRLLESKHTTWEAVTQIGMNKLSPYGRAALIGATMRKPTGEMLTSTGGVAKEMAKQLAPVPISAARPLQAVGHAVAPGTFAAVPSQQVARQMYGAVGLKMEPAQSPSNQMQDKAERFMKENNLKKSSGWVEVQTDEPNYTKLRAAIRNGDDEGAKAVFQGLLQTRTPADVLKAMRLQTVRPFTANKAVERRFVASISPAERELYSQAMIQRQQEYAKFVQWFVKFGPGAAAQ